MNMPLVMLLVALLLLALSVLLVFSARKKASSEKMMGSLASEKAPSLQSRSTLHIALLRAGIQLTSSRLVVAVLLYVLLVMLIYLLLGALMALAGAGLLLFAVKVFIDIRQRRRMTKMVKQLPGFIDHIIRSLKSGRTLMEGMDQAINSATHPLKSAFERSQRFMHRGASMEEAIDDLAGLYQLKEFQLLALAVRVNQKYGGNAVEVLSQLVSMIHERDKAARQLKAMTGETRFSALVLGLLPVSLAAYVFISSPDFFLELWHDPSGQMLLLFAFLFQVVGSLTLWRMLRSV
ncbi:type II secretion system F family protein [Oceanimonas baumannii]|uniref:type II secretion system F family protein n=1 Tax=Oceanimonas baumannii TaxID=129578 RepID=UPI001D18D943|nr:type II secretion system F family protein [Oceanimonas baumannii]MCC4264656.1 type II secretion system F family protein [Oceanimonas baumannii]